MERKHKCGASLAYNEKHDADYCPECDEWVSGQCEDPECEFCRDRPEKPSQAGSESPPKQA